MKLRNFFYSIMACALLAGLLTALVQAQNTPSKQVQNASLIRTTGVSPFQLPSASFPMKSM
jgi:hypothetical protein